MKHIKFLLFTVFAILSFASCSDDDSLDSTEQSSDYVYADFNFGGDFTETELPLSRTDSKKVYYAIDIREVVVYSQSVTGHIVEFTDYVPYAHGIFTTKDNMRIHLKKGQEYRIFSSILKDGADSIYHEGNMFFEPFISGGSVMMENKFVMDDILHLMLDNHKVSVNSKYGESHVEADRYYGCDDFTPENDKNTVNLNLKRYNFGLKLVVVPPVDGSLQIEIPATDYNETVYSYNSTFTDTRYYTTATTSDSYKDNPDYAEDLYINFYWNRADGSKETYNKTIKVKRNTLKILNVNFNKRDYDSSFEFNVEDAMQEETEEIN